MKRNAFIFIIIYWSIALLLAFIGRKAHAVNVSPYLGTSIIHIEPKSYKYINKYENLKNPKLTNIDTGVSFTLENKINIKIGTNRLYSKKQKRMVLHDNSQLELKNKLFADYITFGKVFNLNKHNIIPSLIIANAKLETKLKQGNYTVDNSINHAILYGVNFNYLINTTYSISSNIIAPNNEFGFDYALIFGFNINL